MTHFRGVKNIVDTVGSVVIVGYLVKFRISCNGINGSNGCNGQRYPLFLKEFYMDRDMNNC